MTPKEKALNRLQDDTPLPPEEFYALLPACENNALLLVYVAERKSLRLPPEYEAIIAQDSLQSLKYAERVLKGPFLQGEAAIASNIGDGLQYAERVLQGSFPKMEPLLYASGAPYQLASYALDCAKTRLPLEAEQKILTDLSLAFFYARDILKGPWPELEAALLPETPTYLGLGACVRYADEVLKKPWPALEPLLLAFDKEKPLYLGLALDYATKVKCPLPKNIHEQLMEFDGLLYDFHHKVLDYALAVGQTIPGIEELKGITCEGILQYVEQVSHCPWRSGEPALAQFLGYALRYAKATNAPFTRAVPTIFSKKTGPSRYFNILKAMPACPERDLWLLLSAGYAKHEEAPKVFQALGLDYRTLWPLWDSLDLGRDERKQLLQSLLAPKTSLGPELANISMESM